MEETIQCLLIPTVCEDMHLPGDQRGGPGLPWDPGLSVSAAYEGKCHPRPKAPPQALTQSWVLDAAAGNSGSQALDCPNPLLLHLDAVSSPLSTQTQGCRAWPVPVSASPHPELATWRLEPYSLRPLSTEAPPPPSCFLCFSLVGRSLCSQ